MTTMVREDPLLELARGASRERPWLVIALAVAAGVHVITALAVPRLVHARTPPTDRPIEVVDIDIPKPPPPLAPVEPPKAEEPSPPKPLTAPSKGEPPPPPARAAAVLTRAPDPNEPLDFTGGFVTGSAETYAGGTTAAWGSSPVAVRGTPAARGAPAGNGTAADRPGPTGPDRSRRAAVAGDVEWRCPFPPEADPDPIDHAVVTLRVDVDASGSARSVAMTKDPGHGFGREAQRCAMGKRWSPALDHDGTPVAGSTLVNVRFDR